MKKLSKNKFAKLFATFLGASTILTPLVTIVSCQPISKSPTIEQQNSNQSGNNNQNQNNGQTGGGTGGSGTGGEQNGGGTGETETTTPKPNADETQVGSTIDNTAIIVKNNNSGKYSIKGSIYIDNIGKLETELASLAGLNGEIIDTSTLSINCFETKKEQISGQSITTRNTKNQAITYISKEITPSVLKGVLKLKKDRKFSTLTLNNKISDNNFIDILFTIKSDDENKHFNISDLAKFSFNKDFKLDTNSNIFLQNIGDVRVEDLLKLIKNPKLVSAIKVGKIQLRGNVKDLLPYLVKEKNTIEQEYGNITWEGAVDAPCTGENWVGFNGIINDNGNESNTGRSILKPKELLELKRRSGDKEAYIRNAIITDLDSTKLSPEELADMQFKDDLLTNVNFKNSNLSKITMKSITASLGTLTFENTTLPKSMNGSTIGNLVLKNAILSKELKTIQLKKVLSKIPAQIGTLKIYNLQGRFLDQYTEEEIKQVKKQWQNYGNEAGIAPGQYVGPQDVWNKLKLLFNEKNPVRTHFTNEDLTDVDNDNINFSAIQKPQDTFLALLGKNNSRG